jgi:hypothetical protein
MKKILILTTALIALTQPLFAHVHLESGAYDSNGSGGIDPGDKLALYQSDNSFPALYTGYTLALAYAQTGNYAGYYAGGLTFTVLSTNELAGGDSSYGDIAPLTGSYIEMRLISVTRTDGGAGTFAFWETGSSSPTFALVAGATPVGIMQWNLTQSTADPFGHIHGRQFTVDAPGTYEVVFQLFDTSGSPNHTPSDPFTVTFSAVPEPSALLLLGLAGLVAQFGLRQRKSAASIRKA